MIEGSSLLVIAVVFIVAAAAVWFAGRELSTTTDVLSARFGLGQALGGLLLLAVATNLPELAITAAAALRGRLEIATGNILGGIGVQTVVIVLIDVFGVGENEPCTFGVRSLVPVLEGTLTIAVLVTAIMASRLPRALVFAHLDPGSLAVTAVWVAGVWLVARARTGLPWRDEPGGAGAEGEDEQQADGDAAPKQRQSTVRAASSFALAALVTLVAGYALEESGNGIADRLGISGLIFGATVLAAATALPELSTGIASAKLGDYHLALSDIFGGNAFLPVLFLEATLLSGRAALPQAGDSDIYLAGLGILLTTAYIAGLIIRSRRQVLRMGLDSLAVLLLYSIGLAGLVAVAHQR